MKKIFNKMLMYLFEIHKAYDKKFNSETKLLLLGLLIILGCYVFPLPIFIIVLFGIIISRIAYQKEKTEREKK